MASPFEIVSGDEAEGEEKNGDGEADPVEIAAGDGGEEREETMEAGVVPNEKAEEKEEKNGLLVAEDDKEKVEIEADEKNGEAGKETAGMIRGEGEERVVEEGTGSCLEINGGAEGNSVADSEGVCRAETEIETAMQLDSPAEVDEKKTEIEDSPAEVDEQKTEIQAGETAEKSGGAGEEKGGFEGEGVEQVEEGTGPFLENNGGTEVNGALGAEGICRVETEKETGAQVQSDAPIEVNEESLTSVSAAEVEPAVVMQSEDRVKGRDTEVVISESSDPVDSVKPVEVGEEKLEPEALLAEAIQPEELQSDVGEETQEPEIAVCQVNALEKLKTDVLVEERCEVVAAVVDEKHEPEDVDHVVTESRDCILDSAADTETEHNLVDDKAEHVMESTPVENDEASASNEDNDLPTVNELDEHAQEAESEINLKTGALCKSKDGDEKTACKVIEGKEQIEQSLSSTAIDEERMNARAVERHYCYLIKFRRYDDEMLEKKLQDSKTQLAEKTRIRDSISDAIRKQKVILNEFKEKLQVRKLEERAAGNALNAKRKELDAAQSTIDKMKNVIYIDDQIRKIGLRMQHETIISKQEIQYINELKKLRQKRAELYSTMGSQEDFQKAFEQKDQTEEHLKLLGEEVDSLKTELSLAKARTRTAKAEHDNELQNRQDLQAKHDDANDIQQESYLQKQKLNSDLSKKKKYYYMYKADRRAAYDFVLSGDKEGLQRHCSNQVEKFMELWNDNDEFRNQYIKSNEASTLWKLNTFDGRSLGPDEEPPVLSRSLDKISNTVPLSSSCADTPVSTSAQGTTQKNPCPLPQCEDKAVLPSPKVVQANRSANSKKVTKPSSKVNPSSFASNQEEEEITDMGKRSTKEEEELARKKEEPGMEKVETNSKDEIRSEQMAKARAAVERKKRQAEKALSKAQYKEQKEAEEKAKRKAEKEKKKAGTVESNGYAEGDIALITGVNPPEIAQELEATGTTTSMRSSKPPIALKKTNKIRPLPLPLRKRSKRRMQTWMWVLLATLLILALLLADSFILSPKSILLRLGF